MPDEKKPDRVSFPKSVIPHNYIAVPCEQCEPYDGEQGFIRTVKRQGEQKSADLKDLRGKWFVFPPLAEKDKKNSSRLEDVTKSLTGTELRHNDIAMFSIPSLTKPKLSRWLKKWFKKELDIPSLSRSDPNKLFEALVVTTEELEAAERTGIVSRIEKYEQLYGTLVAPLIQLHFVATTKFSKGDEGIASGEGRAERTR